MKHIRIFLIAMICSFMQNVNAQRLVISPQNILDPQHSGLLLLSLPNNDNQQVTALQDGKAIDVEYNEKMVRLPYNPKGGNIIVYLSIPKIPPADVTRNMNQRQMLLQLGIRLPILPSIDVDPHRPTNSMDVFGKKDRVKNNNGELMLRSLWGLWTNYDDRSSGLFPGADSVLVGNYPDLPVLKTFGGKKVRTKEDWWNIRRPEIVEEVQKNWLGMMPTRGIWPKVSFTVTKKKGSVEGYDYTEQRITGIIDCSRYLGIPHHPIIKAILRLPAHITKAVPVMIIVGGQWAPDLYWKIMAEHGWGVCLFNYNALQPDDGNYLTDYFIGLMNKGSWRKPDDIGTVGAWSWGVSRIIDYLETQHSVNAKAIGISGHSRFGKTALFTMAFDPRIAIGYPSDSGSMGVKKNRRHWGQDWEISANVSECHWFAGNFMKYCGALYPGQYLPRKVANLRIDAQHVLALCAPRPVFLNGGDKSWGLDPYGMFLTAKAATPVWRLLGKQGLVCPDKKPRVNTAYLEGTIGYRLHAGGHTDQPDWPSFFIFSKRIIGY